MNSDEWFEYYNHDNHLLLKAIKQINSGIIEIEIHEKRPVNLFSSVPVNLPENNNRLTKYAWDEYYNPAYLSVIEFVRKIRFGRLRIKIENFKIVELSPTYKMRLQRKHAKNN